MASLALGEKWKRSYPGSLPKPPDILQDLQFHAVEVRLVGQLRADSQAVVSARIQFDLQPQDKVGVLLVCEDIWKVKVGGSGLKDPGSV
jgi:hypothetical protein